MIPAAVGRTETRCYSVVGRELLTVGMGKGHCRRRCRVWEENNQRL